MDGVTLDSVTSEYRKSVLVAKTTSIILNVLVDDIADKRKDRAMVERVFSMISPSSEHPREIEGATGTGQDELDLMRGVWFFLHETIKKYPRYEEFAEIFLYDYRQFLNSALYACLVNGNRHMMNLPEYQMYLSPNMQGMVLVTIDLMASPAFDIKELGMIREVFWKAQRMGRIGNSISTFEREINEDDFTSEVFPYLLSLNCLDTDDLRKERMKGKLDKADTAKAFRRLLIDWENYHGEISEYEGKIKSFAVGRVLRGLEELIAGHLSSVGLK